MRKFFRMLKQQSVAIGIVGVLLFGVVLPCAGLGGGFYTGASSGGNGTMDHALLDDLSFAASGHTGFQASLGYTAENSANKATNTSLGTSDTLYPSQNAVKAYIDTAVAAKQNALGFTAENVANKATNTSLGTSDTLYPSQNAVKSYVDTGLSSKQASLGYTAENSANKATNTSLGTSDTLYPSQNAVKSYVDTGLSAKQNSIGFTPEDVLNKSTNTSLGNSTTLYPSQSAVKSYVDTAVSGKQDSLGFTAEDVANKSTNTSLGTSDTYYPSQNAVKSYVDTGLSSKQASLGFTPEDVLNKSTNTSLGTSDTLYPSQNAVKSYVDTGLSGKQDSLGFTAEDVANKSTNTSLGTSDTLYPSQNAVKSYVDTYGGTDPGGAIGEVQFNNNGAFDGTTNIVTPLALTSTGINDAIDSLGSTGGIVLLPVGTYTMNSTVTIDYANTSIIGAGWGTVLDASAWTQTGVLIDLNGKTGCSVKDLKIVGKPSGASANAMIYAPNGSSYFMVKNVWMYNADYDGVKIAATTQHWKVEDCFFENIDNVGIFDQSGGGVIADNYFKINAGGIICSGATMISRNFFFTSGNSIEVNSGPIYIINNDFSYGAKSINIVSAIQGRIAGNTMMNPSTAGIYVASPGTYLRIEENDFLIGSGYAADHIYNAGDINWIKDNSFRGSTFVNDAIHLTNTSSNNIVAGNYYDLNVSATKVRDEGTNNYIGTKRQSNIASLVNGTVSVNATMLTNSSRIFLSTQTPSGDVGAPYVSGRAEGASFNISSTSGTDNSTVAWELNEPN